MSKSRRSFTAEFKREAVQMIQMQGLSVAETARRLDLHENKLAIILSWYVDFDPAKKDESVPLLSSLILHIPAILDDADDIAWYPIYAALGAYPNLANDLDLIAIYQRAERHLNREE